jgi:hypothetical protein
MLNVIIPKSRFWTADYPNLEAGAEGRVIPRLYGTKAGIVPTCTDTNSGEYTIAAHGLHALTEVYAGVELLTPTLDYDHVAGSATFILHNTPLLASGGIYYLSVEGIDIDVANYLRIYAEPTPGDMGGSQVLGEYYTINDAGAWAASGTGRSACLWLYYRAALSSSDPPHPQTWLSPTGLPNNDDRFGNIADRTRIGQRFRAQSILGGPGYLTAIRLWFLKVGLPTGAVRVRIFSAIAPEAQVGSASRLLWCSDPSGGDNSVFGSTNPSEFFYQTDGSWSAREAGTTQIFVTATGRYTGVHPGTAVTNIADVIEDIMVDEMGVPAGALNAAAFAALAAAKTEEVSLYMDTEAAFQAYLETAEVGQRWRLIPNLSREFSPQWFDPAAPVDPLHLRDEDFITFRMYHDLDAVRQIVRIRYDHTPGGVDFNIVESESAHALFFYRNEETMEFDAYLKTAAEVQAISDEYSDILDRPPVMAVFEVWGHGYNLLPMDRVKLTRRRAMFTGGALDGELFRIIRIHKRISSRTTEFLAVLDSQASIPAGP